MRHIKSIVLLAILLTTVVGFFVIPDISRVHCGFTSGREPVAYFRADGTQITKEQFFADMEQIAREEEIKNGVYDQSSSASAVSPAPSQLTATPASNIATSTPATPKEKLAVYFTDAFGNTLGSSQVTKGTTIAESQFVQDVPECDGKTFDHWDYDGRVIEHQYIVRALYK